MSSDYAEEVTPVPIPNTEVKLLRADGTWTAGSRESRSSLGFPHAVIAQLVEHHLDMVGVTGSSPVDRTK